MIIEDQSKRILSPRLALVPGAGVAPGDALNNVNPDEVVDGSLCFVRDPVPAVYRFVAGEGAAESLPNIVAPLTGTGRWVSQSPSATAETLYVGQHGSDAYNGRSFERAKKTLAAALAAAAALPASAAQPVTVHVVDAGPYEENIEVPAWVYLEAPTTYLQGVAPSATPVLQVNGNATVRLHASQNLSGQGTVFKVDDGNTAMVHIDKPQVVDGAGGYGAVNVAGLGGVLFFSWKQGFAGENTTLIGDISAAQGHIHILGGDGYGNGAGATIVARLGTGSIVGHIDHCLELVAGGTAFSIAGGECDVDVSDLEMTTLCNVGAGGSLNLTTSKPPSGACLGAGAIRINGNGVSADRGDAGATLDPGTDVPTQIWSSNLSADRAVALSTGASSVVGSRFRIVRSGGGGFNLNVGVGPLKALATGEWCEVEYNGTAWILTAYGSL